jgi:hypothetical protein
MRVGWIFLALLFLSCMFIGIQDQNSAHSVMPTDFEPTPEELEWAKKFIYLRYHTNFYQDFYLFSDDRTSLHNWIYAVTEKVFVLVLLWLYWERAERNQDLEKSRNKEHRYIGAFLVLQTVDTMDALFLTHNNAWITIQSVPITCNVVNIAIYSYICLYLRYRYGK